MSCICLIALLKVAEDEELSAAPFNFGVPDLELEEAKLYVGGLPPDVNIASTLMDSVPGSFLGCMKDLQVVAFGLNPLQGSFYGVEASCSSQAINKIAAFTGQGGYIQLKASRPARDVSLSFSFKTTSPEGILFFSIPVPAVITCSCKFSISTLAVQCAFLQELGDDPTVSDQGGSNNNRVSAALKTDKDADVMSVTLRQGQLEARFRSSPTEVVSITSSETYNDGLFHNVVIMRTGRKVELLVDDNSIGTTRLTRQIAPANPGGLDHYHLMVGGVRSEWVSAVTEFIGIHQSFTGCIADLSLNNKYQTDPFPMNHALR